MNVSYCGAGGGALAEVAMAFIAIALAAAFISQLSTGCRRSFGTLPHRFF